MSAAAGTVAPVLVREVVRPTWTPFRPGGTSLNGLVRRRGDGLVRLLHVGGEPVAVAVAQRGERVVLAARAATEELALAGIARLRFATGVDDDLADFHARFRRDAVLGGVLRMHPELRVRRDPHPWETLAWAITEQLIEFDRAVAIQRRMIAALGPRWAGLRDAPGAAVVAAQAPAQLEAFGLSAGRALALRRAAREVAAGRADLAAGDLGRLRAIPGIGTWTLEMLALHGLGRLDVIPAGDLGYLKLVGRVLRGRPDGFADEVQVRDFFAAYAPWAGLAGEYLRLAGATGRLSLRGPRRAGTRWSAARPPAAAA